MAGLGSIGLYAYNLTILWPRVSKQINSSTGLTLVLAGLSQSFRKGLSARFTKLILES